MDLIFLAVSKFQKWSWINGKASKCQYSRGANKKTDMFLITITSLMSAVKQGKSHSGIVSVFRPPNM